MRETVQRWVGGESGLIGLVVGTAVGIVMPGGGVTMAQRPSNSSAKPESGPECSVPATG